METTSTESESASFTTKDLNHAAFMWCQDKSELVKLNGQKSGSGVTVFFQFKLALSREDLHQLQIDFANGKCRVEPGMFVDRQNKLRDLLHGSLGIQTLRREETK